MDHKICYKVSGLAASSSFHHDDVAKKDTPLLGLRFWGLRILGDEERSRAEIGDGSYQPICLYLTKEAAQEHGIAWDGTKQGIPALEHDLVGKFYELDLGILKGDLISRNLARIAQIEKDSQEYRLQIERLENREKTPLSLELLIDDKERRIVTQGERSSCEAYAHKVDESLSGANYHRQEIHDNIRSFARNHGCPTTIPLTTTTQLVYNEPERLFAGILTVELAKRLEEWERESLWPEARRRCDEAYRTLTHG